MPGPYSIYRFLAPLAALVMLAVLPSLSGGAYAAQGIVKDRMSHLASSGSPVVIDARNASLDRQTGIYTATGDVRISQGDRVLTADKVVMDTATGDATAYGNVTLSDIENAMSAERLQMNFDTGLGMIEKGSLFIKRENYHIFGGSLERLSETEFRVVDGSLTTCDGKTPFWRISADDLDVRTDKDVTATNVVMRIKEVPVLYSPYAWFPVLKPRTTGFLIPRMGFSSEDGFKLFESFYWAPTDNFDATIDLDYRGKRGAGAGAEFRLSLDKNSFTRLYGFYMDDRKENRERYNFEFRHSQFLMKKVNLKADVNLSDREFYRDLSDSTKERTQRSIDSNVFATYNTDSGMVYGLAQYTQGLDLNSDSTVQRLPEAGFEIFKKRIYDIPVYLDAAGTAAYFTKNKGVTGGRFDAYPKLTGVFNLWGVNVLPRLAYRETVYSLAGKEKLGLDDEKGLFCSGVTLQAELSRLYSSGPFGITAVKHTIEPVVAYNYVSRRGGTNFPKFDGVDTYGRKSTVAYSLTNRLVLWHSPSDKGQRYSYLTFTVSQMYDYHEDLKVSGVGRRFSPLFAEITYKLPPSLTLNNYWRFDMYGNGMLSADTDVRYDSPDGRWYMLIGQRYTKDTDPTYMQPSLFDFFTPRTDFASDFVVTKKPEGEKVNFLNAEAGFKVGNSWTVAGKAWYDLRTDSFRETRLSVAYESQCWGVGVYYTERPDDHQVMFMLTLKGLGSVKPRLT